MKIVVIGGTGLIGSKTVPILRQGGHEVDLAPAIDPIDIGINSVQTLIDLHDLKLARAEYKVGREIVMRLPIANHNIARLQNAAIEKERAREDEGAVPITLRQTVETQP